MAGGGRFNGRFWLCHRKNYPHRDINKQGVCNVVMLINSILSGDDNKYQNCKYSAVETTEMDARWKTAGTIK